MAASAGSPPPPPGFTPQAVLDELIARRLPASPRNYELWYAHVCQHNDDLSAEIETHERAGGSFDDGFLCALYDKHFNADRQQAAMVAAERIMRELSDVMSVLRATGDKADEYAETLHSTSSHLRDGLDAKALRDIVSGLAAATVDMAEHNRKLSARLEDSSREMSALREKLVKTRHEALTDALTGLANRKMLTEQLSTRIGESRAQNSPLVFLMCDIDHFKRFNDSWGHQTGDQIIRFVASTLAKNARADFTCARFGGEEFCMVMPRTSLAEAHVLAESIRGAIEGKKLFRKSTGEDLGRITISIGLAQWRGDESMESLIERADACLYASKRAGRNRVMTDRQMQARPIAAA